MKIINRWNYQVVALFCILSILVQSLAFAFPSPAYAQAAASSESSSVSARVPLNLSLPSGLTMSTFNGSIGFTRRELQISRGALPLSFAMTWDSDSGWQHNWDIYYTEQRSLAMGTGTVQDIHLGTTVHLGQGRDIVFYSQRDGQFTGPDDYTLTLEGGYTPAYRLQTPDETVYYFDSHRHRHVTRIETREGEFLIFSYNTDGDVTQVTDTHDRALFFSYDAQGRLESVTDPNVTPLRIVQYGYSDDTDDITNVTDPLGQTTQYGYTTEGLLTTITDARGAVTNIVYYSPLANDKIRGYSDRRRVSQVYTANSNYHFTYRLIGSQEDLPQVRDITTVRQAVDSGDRTTTYEYLGGNPVQVTNAEGGVVRMTWNQEGKLATITDENDHTTRYTYDEQGNLITVTDPLSQTTRYTYDPDLDLVTSVTDPNGHTTRYTYDAQGNLLSQTDPLSNTMYYEWQAGYLIRVTDALSHTIAMGYDAYGRTTVITDSMGHTQRMEYDALGNLAWQTNANGYTTTLAYDTMGRVITATDPLSGSSYFEYDAVGNIVGMTDPNGSVARFIYDDLGQRTAIVDPVGGITHFAYDGAGNVTTVTDPAGHTTTFGYDALDRQIRIADAQGQGEILTYDAAGNIKTRTDAEGRTTTYTYDAADRLTHIDYPISPDVIRAYDPAGRLTLEANGTVTLTYAYDAADRLTAVQIAPFSKTVSYTYNALGQRVSMTDPDDGVTAYAYDDAGRLIRLTDPLSRTTEFTYDAGGRVTRQTFPNGARVEASFDANDQATALDYRDPEGALLLSRAYTYDAAGNRLTEADESGGVITYTYDSLYQLIGAQFPDGNFATYTYDAAGNRTAKIDVSGTTTYTYDTANQLLAASGTIFAHDAAGNRVGETNTAGTTTYTYSEENLLTAIHTPEGTPVSFDYYPDGRRLSRTDENGTTYYFYDQLNVLLETDDNGATTARYSSVGLDRWLAQTRGGETHYYLPDALGSIIGLLDEAGSLAATYTYQPFGALRSQTEEVTNPYLFAGRRYENGWYYNRMRSYDPHAGRFTTRDPLGMPDGPNRYIYVLNNPVIFIDPTGKDTWIATELGCSGALGIGFSLSYGTMFNPRTGEHCQFDTFCITLGAQANAAAKADIRIFNGPTEGHRIAGDKWSIEAGISAKLGPASAGIGLEIDTETGEISGQAEISGPLLGVPLGVSASQSTQQNRSIEVGITEGIGFSYVRGKWCKTDIYGCQKPSPLPIDQPTDITLDPPPHSPGGDHPDENASAASAQTSASSGPIYRAQPYVGLLWRGYAEATGKLVNQAGEPYIPVYADFSPELAYTVPVLVIPSGGLYGLQNSASFRARLAAYVELGGTIISFDQQRGSHFNLLPYPAGSEPLGGYGWREDNSCFRASLYLSSYHPIVSSFDEAALDAHVDGYFTTLPTGASELLNRAKNGQPGLILYPYPAEGQGGYVLATTIYDDWGTANFQRSGDALILVRDMLSWAFDPAATLTEYGPSETVSLPITVTNGTSNAATSIDLTVLRPDRTTAQVQTVPLSVSAGSIATPTLTWTLPAQPQLGIWWVAYTLRDAEGHPVQQEAVGRRFVVSDPSPITGPDRDLSLSVTAPTEHYVQGTQGEFTFHVYNHSNVPRTVEVRYGLPHHTWETYNLDYGYFRNRHHTLVVDANAEATFLYTPTIVTTDRLFAYLYENRRELDRANSKVWRVPAAVQVTSQADTGPYPLGEEGVITTTFQNLNRAVYNAESILRIFDPNENLVHETSFTSTLPAESSVTSPITFVLPVTSTLGFYKAQVETLYNNKRLGVGVARFEALVSEVYVTSVQPSFYIPDASNILSFSLKNIGAFEVQTGVFSVTLEGPEGTHLWDDNQSFTLPVGQEITLTFPIPLTNQFGNYRLFYQAFYVGPETSDSLDIPFTNSIELSFDRSHYDAGNTMGVDVQVTNHGLFQENLSVLLESPSIAYSQTYTLNDLSPGQAVTIPYAVALPITLTAGSYPITATLRLASGSQEQWGGTFSVPPSKLSVSAPPSATVNEAITLTIANVGGAATGVGYEFVLRDTTALTNTSGTIANIWPGDSESVTFTVPIGAKSGDYVVTGKITNTQTSKVSHVSLPIEIDGMSALLEIHPEKQIYLSIDPITATARLTATGTPLTGVLSLQALATSAQDGQSGATPLDEWVTHVVGDHGPLNDRVTDIVMDSQGQLWFRTSDGVSVLDDGGTPFDKSDDAWQSFTSADGLANNDVLDIVIDGSGYIWFALNGGDVSVLDDGGTLFDKSDDAWQTFTDADGLITNYTAQVIIVDESNRKWIGTDRGLSVLDDGGTLFNKSDDNWQSFTDVDGLAANHVNAAAIDGAGNLWLSTFWHGGGVNVLDHGGTPFDKSDDSWQFFAPTDGLADDCVRAISIDADGYIWFVGGGSDSSASVLNDGGTPLNKADDAWQTFTDADGLAPNSIGDIIIDATGLKWFSAWNSGGGSVLDDGGTPFDKSDDAWQSFTTADGLSHNSVFDISPIDGTDYKWFGTDAGVNILDDGGTPFNKADDAWQSFTTAEGLANNTVYAITNDGAGHMWFGLGFGDFGSNNGASLLDESGTPLDKSDDIWESFPFTAAEMGGRVNAITTDRNGHIWFGNNDSGEPVRVLDDGGTPFDKTDDVWQSFTTADGLAGSYIEAIVVDSTGYKWFGTSYWGASVLDDGGTLFDKSDDVWQTFTPADGMANDRAYVIVIDDDNLKWFGGHYSSMSVLDDCGTPFDKLDDTWRTFTTADGLVSDHVQALAIDETGYKWIGTDSGVSVLNDGGTPFDKFDDAWLTFTTADGLVSNSVDTLAIDNMGRVWFGFGNAGGGASVLDNGGTPFDKLDDTWQTFTTAAGLADENVRVIATDGIGRLWFGTDGGASMLGGEISRGLWQEDFAFNPVGTTYITASIGTLNATGKLYLQGIFTSTTGQVIAQNKAPFYVFPTEIGLTLATDKTIYRPDHPITLTGQIYNGSAAPLLNQTLVITQDDAVLYTTGPFDLSTGDTYFFTVTTTAPSSPGSTYFAANVHNVKVEDEIPVALPQVTAGLDIPNVVGRDPFSLTIALTNTGQIAGHVQLTVALSTPPNQQFSKTLNLASGTMQVIRPTFQVTQDTVFTVTFTGDLTQTFTHTTLFGESAVATFAPESRYCPGLHEIPYTITNTGQLDTDFSTCITLTNGMTSNYVISTYLPLSSTHQGTLGVDLSPADYALIWQHPFGGDQANFTVIEANRATFQTSSGSITNYHIPLTATVTNTGCNPFSGTVQVIGCKLQATGCEVFDVDEHTVNLGVDASGIYTLPLNTTGLTPGIYSATLSLFDQDHISLTTDVITGTIPNPDLVITTIPTITSLNAGETVTFTFAVQNQGETDDQAHLTFTFGDFEDETQVQWLNANTTGYFTYTFYIPQDLATDNYYATYILTGTLDPEKHGGDLIFPVTGISLTAKAHSDQVYYTQGEPATVTLTITNCAPLDTGDLTALLTFNGVTQTQTFSLTQGTETQLDFPLTANFAGDAKVFYGIYYAGTDRSIYLNTLYLRQQQPAVTVLTDKQVYQPGEMVTATVVTTLTQGMLNIHVLDYATSIPITKSSRLPIARTPTITSSMQFTFTLPTILPGGTYAIYYTTDDSDTAEDGREHAIPFDVDGPLVFVQETTLTQNRYVPGNTVTLDLTIFADRKMDVTLSAWIQYPDGSEGPTYTQTLSLDAVPNNQATIRRTITDTQIGSHQILYRLDTMGEAVSAEDFDVGWAELHRVTTGQASYANMTDLVQVLLEVYSHIDTSALVLLTLDSGLTTTHAISLNTGYQILTETITGPILAGERTLTATLKFNEYQSEAQANFEYGSELPDLYIGAPKVAQGNKITRTLSALVGNIGNYNTESSIAVHFYNGQPSTSTLIATTSLVALEAGGQTVASAVWDIQGQGGAHTLYAIADAADAVNEFNESNNVSQGEVVLPRLESDLSALPGNIMAGESVTLTTWLENLQENSMLPVTASVRVRSPLGVIAYSQTWSQTLGNKETQWIEDVWHSDASATPGTYIAQLEVVDTYGVHNLSNTSFAVYAPPPQVEPKNVDIIGTTKTTIGILTQFTATVSPQMTTLPLTYTWIATGKSTVTKTGGLTNSMNITWGTLGLKMITVTARNNVGIVTDSQTITVADVCTPLQSIDINGPTTALSGKAVWLSAAYTPTDVTDVTFLWDSGATDSNASYTWSAGVHTVVLTATAACGDQLTTTHTVTVTDVCTPLQSITIHGPITASSGTVVWLTATYTPTDATGVTFLWDNSTRGSRVSYTWATGIHTVVVTATAACGDVVTATHTVTVTDICLPLHSMGINGPTMALSGTEINLTAVYTPSDATDVVFLWDNGTTDANASYTWATGIHTVVVTATAACGDVVTATHTVTVTDICIPLQSVGIDGPTTALSGTAVWLSAVYTPSNATDVTFLWDNGIIGTNASYTWSAGVHTVALTMVAACGDRLTTTHTVTVTDICTPLQSISIHGPITASSGTAVLFTATYTPTDATGVTFLWDNGTRGSKTNYTWAAGTHTVVVTATAACGDEITATHTVTVTDICLPLQSVGINGPTTALSGTAVWLSAVYTPSDATDVTFLWDSGIINTDASYTWSAGIHTVTLTATAACSDMLTVTHTVTVTDVCTPLQSIEIHGPITANNGTAVWLTATYTPTDATGVTFLWDNGTRGTSANYTWEAGIHKVVVTATAACGYPVTAMYTITVMSNLIKPDVPILLFPPNNTITATQDITFKWQAGTGETPIGYNVSVDNMTITTTKTISSTWLSIGIHTWTVRAYNVAGYSNWANAWTIEMSPRWEQKIYLPLILKNLYSSRL